MPQKSLDKRLQSERRRQVRKEKSKEAARCRRGKEGEVFAAITDTLPINESVKAHLDKTSIIRLCINYMRTRDLLSNVCCPADVQNYLDDEANLACDDVVSILHGFVLVLTPWEEIAYATGNVKQLMGHCELDLIGQSLDTFIHPADWDEMEQQLKSSEPSFGFTARFKSHLSRSRGSNFKSSSYKALRFTGKRLTADVKPKPGTLTECMLLTATPIEHPSLVHEPLDSMTFTSRHGLDMKFTDCDKHTKDLTGYTHSYLMGKSFYDLVHPSDIKATAASFRPLASKEHVVTDPYKLLTCAGGYVYVVTQASVTCDPKTSKPQYVLCVNRVISGQTDTNVILADVQMAKCLPTVKVEKNLDVCVTSKQEPTAADESDDIFTATMGVFKNPAEEADEDDLDIMGVTASIFGEDTGSDVVNSERLPSKTEFEALVEELDNDPVDMNRGLFVDLADIDEEFYLRAPYIPMEEISDMPIIDSWCEGFNSYRQEDPDGTSSNIPSPLSSSSPGQGTDAACSPANSPPAWQQDAVSASLTSELEKLSYGTSDGGFGDSVETALNSLTRIDSLNERLTCTDGEMQTSPKNSWQGRHYAVYEGESTDLSKQPSNTSHTYHQPQGQQYIYSRRKRKADTCSLDSSPLRHSKETPTSFLQQPLKTSLSPSSQLAERPRLLVAPSRRLQPHCHSPPSSNVTSSHWNDWQMTSKAAGLKPQLAANVEAKIKPPLTKEVSSYNNGWLSVSPTQTKYKPTHRTAKRVEKCELKGADCLLMNLLQQT